MGQLSENWTSADGHPAPGAHGPASTVTAVPAWYPDPSGRHDHRWFNGSTWTADVADDGQRGYDPQLDPDQRMPERPGRAAALTSLTLGVTSLTIAWMPFVVVLGVVAALSAIVLGIVAVGRSRQGRQAGRGLASAGIACGACALALSGVGMASSRQLLDDLRATRDPGAHTVGLIGCEVDTDGRARATGQITNRAESARSYAITVSFGDAVRDFADRTVRVTALAPGETERFEAATSAGGTPTDELSCSIERVSTPTLLTSAP